MPWLGRFRRKGVLSSGWRNYGFGGVSRSLIGWFRVVVGELCPRNSLFLVFFWIFEIFLSIEKVTFLDVLMTF